MPLGGAPVVSPMLDCSIPLPAQPAPQEPPWPSRSRSRRAAQLRNGCAAARDLLALAAMVNQAVGDALSGLLLAEAALRRCGWGLAEWDALYADLPSRQLKARARAPPRAPRALPDERRTRAADMQSGGVRGPLHGAAPARAWSSRRLRRPQHGVSEQCLGG